MFHDQAYGWRSVSSNYCWEHRNDSRWIVLKQMSSLAELSLLGGPQSRRKFQEIESDILQQVSSTMHNHLPVTTSRYPMVTGTSQMGPYAQGGTRAQKWLLPSRTSECHNAKTQVSFKEERLSLSQLPTHVRSVIL